MKKIFELLYVIPIYIFLFALNNCRVIFNNIREGISFFSNVEFMNFSLLVALLVFLLIILLKKHIKDYKNIYLSFIIISLITTVLNGICINDKINTFLLLYSFIIYNTFIYSIIFKKNFEISLVQSTSILILIAIVLAMFNLLKIVKYILIIYICISFLVVLLKKEINKTNLDRINSCGIIIFSILFLIALIGGINRYLNTWDEFSHWGFDAKAVIEYDKLSTAQEIASYTRSYPPVLSVWHYIVNIFTGFSEQNLYIGLSIFIFIFIMPMFSYLNNKKILPLLMIAAYGCCLLFEKTYGYDILYADLPIAAVFFTTFSIYEIFKKDFKTLQNNLAINLVFISLVKPTGFLLSVVFVCIIMLEEYFKRSNDGKLFKKFFDKLICIIKKYWKLIIASIGAFILWHIYVKICNCFLINLYDVRILPESLETALSYKLNASVLLSFIKNFIISFEEVILYGVIEVTLWQFLIIVFFILFLVNYLKYGELKKSFINILPTIIGYLVFFALTVLSIFVMFSVYEATKLASFARYLNVFHYALIMYIIYYISREDFLTSKRNKLFTVIILLAIIFSITFPRITYFISDYSERMDTISFNYSMRERFEKINNIVPEDSSVFVLDQEDNDNIMAMWYSRYYLFPRKVNASSVAITWKVRTEKNKEDLREWGLTATQFEQHLIEYGFDYLYLYSYDEELLDNISYMMTGDYNKKTLFRVIVNNNAVELAPIL